LENVLGRQYIIRSIPNGVTPARTYFVPGPVRIIRLPVL
jgi:hypothetical protein